MQSTLLSIVIRKPPRALTRLCAASCRLPLPGCNTFSPERWGRLFCSCSWCWGESRRSPWRFRSRPSRCTCSSCCWGCSVMPTWQIRHKMRKGRRRGSSFCNFPSPQLIAYGNRWRNYSTKMRHSLCLSELQNVINCSKQNLFLIRK